MKILKTKNKLISIAILFIGIIIMTAKVNAQITGSGSSPHVALWNGTSSITNSIIQDNGTNVGIGLTPSSFKLDVSGDINIASVNAYHIGGQLFLWNNNITSNTFVGLLAGTGDASSYDEIMIGTNAGNTSNGYDNVYIGYQSQYNSPGGLDYQNAAVGSYALNRTGAYGGCALGFSAGYNNTYGCSLVAIGEYAAWGNQTADRNCVIGHRAAYSNLTGTDNAGQTPTRFSFTSSELQSLPPGCSA